jgi:hypothetical protein
MSVIPIKKSEQLAFCESHAKTWLASPAAVGLTPQQCDEFNTLTGEARVAFNEAVAARDAAKAATTNQDAKLGAAVRRAADLIRFIRAFASTSADPNVVYSIAQIPPPAQPVPAQPPGKPDGISVILEPTGAVTLTWSADNAAASTGGFFDVMRKLPGQTAFTPMGGTPGATSRSRRMSFTDATIPPTAASAGAQYVITGRRGTLVGPPSDAITVQFGIDGIGTVVVGDRSEPLKMAA